METLADLVQVLRDFSRMEPSKENAERIFGWIPLDIKFFTPAGDESVMMIFFEKGLVIEARYFLNDSLRDLADDLEVRLMLRAEINSRVGYNVFYSRYIHGQGYIRVSLREVDNKMVQKILDEYYTPRLRSIYKPIILEFKGFRDRDFFGVEAGREGGYIYYSPVRPKSGELGTNILDVVAKLYHLEAIMKDKDIQHQLAELELQMSFLPSVMWI